MFSLQCRMVECLKRKYIFSLVLILHMNFSNPNELIRSTVAGRNPDMNNIYIENEEIILLSVKSGSAISCIVSCIRYCSCGSVAFNEQDGRCFGYYKNSVNTSAENVTDADWKYFDLLFEMECKTTSTGTEYKGSLNVTITGRTCQRWNTNTPHYIFEANRMTEDDKNYCRNPDNENGGPWCHTTDPGMRWEYCNVAMCTCVHSNK